MTDAARPCVIAGNWKMYKTIDQALSFLDIILPVAPKCDCEVLLAVPFTIIESAAKKAEASPVLIGAQNMNDASEGAFTGEVAASMLKDAGAKFVLLGHSERRTIFKETDEFINRKIKRASEIGLLSVLCVGETNEEREGEKTREVLKQQLSKCLEGVKYEKGKLMVAYEPVWAIGTGKAATNTIAEEAHAFIRGVLRELYGEEVANGMPILYGGSVNASNAATFLKEPDVDGLLIGSASLGAESFAKILELRQNRANT
jgi:triosephosphate isomerase (TIM)